MRGKRMHTGSANRREMNVVERMNLEKHIRRLQRGIVRREKRHARWASYFARGDHPDGQPAARRRRQIASGRLKAENGLVGPFDNITSWEPTGGSYP